MLGRSAVLGLVLALAVLQADDAEARRSRKPKDYVDSKLKEMTENVPEAKRQGKVFSLFNVVTFDNSPCTSTSAISGGGTGATRRNGTCFTSSECSDKGGTAAGNCAAGFGVCCVFIIRETGRSVDQNCSYIQNPNFPATYNEDQNVMYTINKCDESVCAFRLDFESFSIAALGNSEEAILAAVGPPAITAAPAVCRDSMTATVTTGQRIPTICGENTGQHMYLDVGRGTSDSATLQFSFNQALTSQNRQWEIKVTQVKCGSENPHGCLQYHQGISGRFSTFNFIPTNDNHLPDQDYSICIRQEEGFCCIQYYPCDDAGSMSLFAGPAAAPVSAHQSTGCTLDYLEINGGSSACDINSGQNTQSIYCGGILSTLVGIATEHDPVCDCTAPFSVRIHTDDLDDAGVVLGNTAAAVGHSRGLCLTYMQVPCDNP